MNEPKDALELIVIGLIGCLGIIGLWHSVAVWYGNPGIELLWGGAF